MRVVLVVVALWAAGAAAQTGVAQTEPGDAPVTPPAPSSAPAAPGLKHWLIDLDVGVPDGLALGGGYRPVYWFRGSAAVTYNILGVGVRASATLALLDAPITPTLNVDIGHFFQGDASSLVSSTGIRLTQAGMEAARHISYDYGNLHVGVELGLPSSFVLYLRAGVSYLVATIRNFQSLLADPALQATAIQAADPVLSAIAPSLKLGVIAYF